LDEAGALVALDAASKESGLPAFDPVRHGADGLLDALLA
jgi:uncharacterized NAD-dependent epimerase/dehydratase family protein